MKYNELHELRDTIVNSYVEAIYRRFRDDMSHCYNTLLEGIISDRMNMSMYYDMLYDFINQIELYHDDVVDLRENGKVILYTEWCAKLGEEASLELYEEMILKYFDFLRRFCLKYNIYVNLELNQKKYLEYIR